MKIFNSGFEFNIGISRILFEKSEFLLSIKPTIGQMGYVKIEHMWFTNKEFTQNTNLDVKGTLSCKVVRINGYTEYSQVTIEFPTYDSAGEIQIISNGVAFDQFIWLQEDIKDSI